MPVRKSHGKTLKKPGKQTVLQIQPPVKNNSGTEQLAQYEMKLEPISDKKSYENFVKITSMKIYREFEKSLRNEGVDRPEIMLVGFDAGNTSTPAGVRMAEYLALNARLMTERAFMDLTGYVKSFMPRVAREMEFDRSDDAQLLNYVESRIRRDLMMEIRVIAMLHIPEEERFRYVGKLKEF